MPKEVLDYVTSESQKKINEIESEDQKGGDADTRDDDKDPEARAAKAVDARAATAISEALNKKFDPTWHCVIGKNFSTCVHD